MKNNPVVVLQAGGHNFIVYADTENCHPVTNQTAATLLAAAAAQSDFGDQKISGIIRAVPLAKLPEKSLLFQDTPEAKWYLDYVEILESDPLQLKTASVIGALALQALTHYLLKSELLTLVDRRETITIATSSGIRDLLAGQAGYSVDVGTWKFLTAPAQNADDDLVLAVVELENTPYFVKLLTSSEDLLRQDVSVCSANAGVYHSCYAAPAAKFLADGIGHLEFINSANSSADGLAVIAAALASRAYYSPKTHHWRVTTPAGAIGVRMYPTEDGERVALSGAVQEIAVLELSF